MEETMKFAVNPLNSNRRNGKFVKMHKLPKSNCNLIQYTGILKTESRIQAKFP